MSIAVRRKVLLLEFNEITWTVAEPMMKKGKLPNLAAMCAGGTKASPVADEHPPYLDPWITWITLHTGVPRSVHGASVLGQDAHTITAKSTWQYAAEAGRCVGVFGSIGAHPATPVPGFVVPGPFAPDNDTFPPELQPVQALNRRYTQVHARAAEAQSVLEMVSEGAQLFKLGLRPATCARVARQLVEERLNKHVGWKRVALQPLINYDFFAEAYRRYQPDFATWHTNHAAHYMHHYWRAYDDREFLVRATPEEKARYGAAVEYGYEVCDELLGKFMKLVGDDTIIVLASSMGQQPYVTERFPKGRIIVRFKNLQRILDIVGAQGVTEVVPTMVPQYNVKIPDNNERARVRGLLEAARRGGHEPGAAISVEETDQILTVTPKGLSESGQPRYYFDGAPNADTNGYDVDELFAMDTPTPKQGYHHPRGLLVLWGPGIRQGVDIAESSNLDVAPTLLSLLDIPVPPVMTGRVLTEAWQAPSQPKAAE